MTTDYAPQLQRTSERGVLLPLAAIIGATLLFILIALGIDTGLTKLVRSSAQEAIEEICQAGGEGLPVTRVAVANIASKLNNLRAPPPLGKGGIKWGEIVGFRIISPTSPANETVKNGPPFFSGAPGPAGIVAAGVSCPLDNGTSCLFGGDATSGSVAGKYPAQFWNPDVPTALSQTSVENNHVYGDIVACEMTVRVKTFVQQNIEVNVKSAYDKRQRGALFPPSSTGVPPANARAQRGGGLLLGISTHMTTRKDRERFQFKTTPVARYNAVRPYDPQRTGSPLYGFTGARTFPDGASRALVPTGFSSGSDEQIERMTACMNLPILVRNVLLTRILGYATRDSLRDRTEIVHLGTKLPGEPLTLLQPPTIMFRGWQDIANNTLSSNGHLPFVWHPSAAGVVATDPRVSSIVGQLRDCEHLYDGQTTNLRRYVDSDVVNLNFESAALSSRSLAPLVFTPPYSAAVTRWGRSVTDPFETAEQVVSILGSTQLCPQGGSTCLTPKPAMKTNVNEASEDLRPDLVAFMRFARGLSSARAYPAPGYGLLPPIANQPVFSTDPAILVVLHERVTAAEAAAIAAELPDDRSITVLYIPSDQYNAAEQALVNLRTAFNAQGPTSATPTGNLLYPIAPTTCPSGTTCAAATQAQWDAHFQEYWMRLLDPGTPNNIEQIGQTIYDRLKYLRLRL